MSDDQDMLKGVAIIGMGGRFPGAAEVDHFGRTYVMGLNPSSFSVMKKSLRPVFTLSS